MRLVIGGSKDGEFVDWPVGFGYYNVPKMNKPRKVFDLTKDYWEESTISIETYRDVLFIIEGKRVNIWAHTAITQEVLNSRSFIQRLQKLLAPEPVGGKWECRYFPRDDTLVYSYNPFGDQWHVYLNVTMEIRRARSIMRGSGDMMIRELLKAQRKMTFYKIERIPLENVNQTVEIGQGHS